VTGWLVKNQVNMEPVRLVVTPVGDGRGLGFQGGVDFGVGLQVAQHGQTGGDGERIAGEGSGLVDRAEGGDTAHDAGATAIGPRESRS